LREAAMTRTEHSTTANVPVSESIVYVVDDDSSLREALSHLMEVVGLKAECFTSAQDFLKKRRPDVASCLVLDVRMPGASGLTLQDDLAKAGVHIPIIFMTAHGDIPMTVQAMKAGAVEFLVKPFRDQDLLDAIQIALEQDRNRRKLDKSQAELRARFSGLTQREREIMELVAAGLMNKQIAAKIALAEITVKIHRSNVMRKMGAKSLAELVKMAQTLGITAEEA
jgi:FixJ family two-component response regulator